MINVLIMLVFSCIYAFLSVHTLDQNSAALPFVLAQELYNSTAAWEHASLREKAHDDVTVVACADCAEGRDKMNNAPTTTLLERVSRWSIWAPEVQEMLAIWVAAMAEDDSADSTQLIKSTSSTPAVDSTATNDIAGIENFNTTTTNTTAVCQGYRPQFLVILYDAIRTLSDGLVKPIEGKLSENKVSMSDTLAILLTQSRRHKESHDSVRADVAFRRAAEKLVLGLRNLGESCLTEKGRESKSLFLPDSSRLILENEVDGASHQRLGRIVLEPATGNEHGFEEYRISASPPSHGGEAGGWSLLFSRRDHESRSQVFWLSVDQDNNEKVWEVLTSVGTIGTL